MTWIRNHAAALAWVVALLVIGALIGYTKHRSDQADRKIVQTGRIAIESGCRYDNKRSQELRGILRRNEKNIRRLDSSGAFPQKEVNRQLKIIRRDIEDISIRDCRRAAKVLETEQ